VATPRDYLAQETLSDGTKVTVRAIRPEDAPSLLDAFGKLDQEGIYRRFFSPKKELSATELKQLTRVDFSRVVALVATMEADAAETLMAGGRYAADTGNPPQGAELAFLTAESYRGRGIAGLLLRHLALLAREAGLSRLEADVLAENQPMLNVFRRSGLQMAQRREGDVVHITLSLEPSPTA
jgi:RimJ/RimL family protein N-acetyltransferase